MICISCFIKERKPHGNSAYCEECADEINNINSKISYAEKAIKANKYWLSERALKSAWRITDRYKIHNLDDLIEMGLDINNYRTKNTINNKVVYIYGKFGFYYLNEKTIIICKI